MKVLIGTGQSDMESSSAGFGGDRTTEPGVFCWEQFPKTELGQTKGWKEAGPDHPDFPWNNGTNTPNGGILYARARHIKRTTGEDVYIIRQAHGGQPILQFLPGGSVWPSLMTSIMDAAASPEMASRAGLPLADELHFSQGQADANYTGATGAQWLSRLLTFFGHMRKKQAAYGNVQPIGLSTPIALYEVLDDGQTSAGSPTGDRNAEIRQFANGIDPYVISVSSAAVSSPDGLHIDIEGLEDMGGLRAAIELAKLPKVCRYEELRNGIVFIDGDWVTVNAGQAVSVPLPVPLVTSYVPVLTLGASGSSNTYMPKIINRTATSFGINNPTSVNMIIGWTITGRRQPGSC